MQQIIQGIELLPQILKKTESRKLFLVVDSSYPFLIIRDAVEALEVDKIRFSDFTPNPIYEQICKGIAIFQDEKCDGILAVGGGSAIDVAKCIKLAVLVKDGNSAIIPPRVYTSIELDGNRIPFIAIPTTAGTGSESTRNAVMYYEGVKQTVTNNGILPNYAILEPSVLNTLPLYQKKCTMMDALCQGIESWWSINSTNESKGYSKIAVEMIMKYWKPYIFENDTNAATQIMFAANYAGRAINISATTAAHAMSYKITSLYKLPHGHAVAVCLPEIWEYMLKNPDMCIDSRGKGYMLSIFLQISEGMGVKNPTEAITVFRELMKDMEMKNPMAVNREKELYELSKSVNPVRLKNNPVALSYYIAKELYSIIII